MTELTDAHFELHSANKDRMYQKRKQAEEILKELLTKFKTDDLIDMLYEIRSKTRLIFFNCRVWTWCKFKFLWV
jgi:hypothetical protein